MASLNSCSFIGTVGADPVVKTFDSGNKVCNFNIAVNEKYATRTGEQKENTEWISLVFNGNLAEVCEKFVKKGSLIYVNGKLRSRQWDDHDGNTHYVTEINVRELQLLSKKETREGERPSSATSKSESYRSAPSAKAFRSAPQNSDEDLPF